MIKNLCLGTNASMGGVQGGRSRGRKAKCPVCCRMITMRAGRAGRLYPHSADRPPVLSSPDADAADVEYPREKAS